MNATSDTDFKSPATEAMYAAMPTVQPFKHFRPLKIASNSIPQDITSAIAPTLKGLNDLYKVCMVSIVPFLNRTIYPSPRCSGNR
jgi:hypothetical protein